MTSENKNYSAMEVGCLLLASLAYDVANLSVKGDGAQIFTQAEFSKMEKTIKGEKELSVYRIYTALHKGIVESYNKGSLTLTDKFWRGIEAQRALVRACHKAENSQKYFLKAPLVVTEHQRQDMYARAEACKKEQPHSIGWLTLYTIQHFATYSEEAPDYLKAPLLRAKNQSVTDKAVIKQFSDLTGLGCYQLPDGTKVTALKEKGFYECLDPFWMSKAYKDMRAALNSEEAIATRRMLLFEGAPAVQRVYTERTGKRITSTRASQLYNELSEKYADSIGFPEYTLPSQEVDRLYTAPEYMTKWRTYARLPKGITAHTVLRTHPECYLYAADAEGADYKNAAAAFPEIWSAALQYIGENLAAEKELDDVVTLGDLAEHGFLDFQRKAKITRADLAALFPDDTIQDFTTREKLRHSGLAVWEDEFSGKIESFPPLDEYNHLPISIDDAINDGVTSYVLQVRKRRMITSTLCYVVSFNCLMDILSDFVFVPELKTWLKIDEAYHKEYIDKYNNAIYALYDSVVGNPAEKQRKRAIIKKWFPPIDISAARPTKKACKKIVNKLNKLPLSDLIKAFTNLDRLIVELSEGRAEVF